MSNDMSMMTDMAISSAMQPNLGVHSNEGMALRQTTDPEQKEKELREASQGFEAIFLQKMWEEMRASIPENSFHGSKEEKHWQSMYAQYLGEEMAQNGGIGLADMMMSQLTKETVKSPSSANIFNRAPMSVSPAPLFGETQIPLNENVSSQGLDASLQNQAIPANQMHGQGKSNAIDDSFYEEMDSNTSANTPVNTHVEAQTQMAQSQMHANHEPMVTTTRKETNGNGRTTTRTISMPLSEYQASLAQNNKNATNVDAQNPASQSTSHPAVESFAKEQALAPSYAEESEAAMVQDAMARQLDNKPSAAPESALMRQTLDELQNRVANAPLHPNDPIVIHTQYRTNLPASERKQAIMGANGQISKEHEQAVHAQIAEHQKARAEQERLASMSSHDSKNYDVEMHEYPEELMGLGQASQNRQEVENIQEHVTSLAPNDPLAGIETRYVSPTQLRMQEAMRAFEEKLARENKAQEEQEVQAIMQVQAEIDMLMTRADRSNYMFASASPDSMPNHIAHNSLENMLANSTQINDTSNLIAVNTSNAHSVPTLPVYRTMPSLDEALKSGSLIASLTPEEIRLSQMGETNITNSMQTAERHLLEDTMAQKAPHAGGSKFLQPEEAFPLNASTNKEGMQYVSGVSPQMSMQAPLTGAINSPFGWRLDPLTNERAWHTGIDIEAKAGSAVQVAASGRVIFAGDYEDLGNTIIVEHANGMQSVYGHNSELLVQEGEEISAGTNIAKVGTSGRTSGAHLHFEVRHNGLAINPEPYLLQNNA